MKLIIRSIFIFSALNNFTKEQPPDSAAEEVKPHEFNVDHFRPSVDNFNLLDYYNDKKKTLLNTFEELVLKGCTWQLILDIISVEIHHFHDNPELTFRLEEIELKRADTLFLILNNCGFFGIPSESDDKLKDALMVFNHIAKTMMEEKLLPLNVFAFFEKPTITLIYESGKLIEDNSILQANNNLLIMAKSLRNSVITNLVNICNACHSFSRELVMLNIFIKYSCTLFRFFCSRKSNFKRLRDNLDSFRNKLISFIGFVKSVGEDPLSEDYPDPKYLRIISSVESITSFVELILSFESMVPKKCSFFRNIYNILTGSTEYEPTNSISNALNNITLDLIMYSLGSKHSEIFTGLERYNYPLELIWLHTNKIFGIFSNDEIKNFDPIKIDEWYEAKKKSIESILPKIEKNTATQEDFNQLSKERRIILLFLRCIFV